MLAGPVQGRFFELLVHATGAKRILEVGTFTGYSALSMAAALPEDGRIDTLEIEPGTPRSRSATSTAARTVPRSRLHLGPAIETIEKLEGEFDFVFIDADKPN